jgi:hypothetical protein
MAQQFARGTLSHDNLLLVIDGAFPCAVFSAENLKKLHS